MTETLPITINVNKDLLDKFTNIKSVINKLEAQFNFQTLTANWYGDEEEILTIQLSLVTPTSFEQFKKGLDSLSTRSVNISHFSDDVICCFNEDEQQLLCTIAITASESDLLVLQPTLLAGYIQAKLRKVLNLIAQQQSLTSI
ncbi:MULTISPECIES: hypothetical protein [Colwellia]|jgi:hypothetical protein|uniref:Uncharacterized protein n=1 Tax=Colwellia psychrerythraea (strain 34H / ATCC BAA-681) TaxID=167879 RepID=Q47VV9_COLP3|nr:MULTISPECIES: hypothetical protein [Colwellia]AAZ24820.1 hypothetical protein CPS_4414 [Colwellia psychrerythraea 34H]PKH85575.1 hypothetical protein CXF79_20185 [Colwellia sp. Bg11-28]